MKKIPSIFERDWKGNRSLLLPVMADADVLWVFSGEGVATVKWDGSAVMLNEAGELYVRYDAKAGRVPVNFIPCQAPDLKTGHHPGWIPAEGNRAAKWHIDALKNTLGAQPGRTYEAVGPSHQSNPHKFKRNMLVPHAGIHLANFSLHTYSVEQSYMACKTFLANLVLTEDENHATTKAEGIVWHHPDGRMAKVKAGDLGLDWPPVA